MKTRILQNCLLVLSAAFLFFSCSGTLTQAKSGRITVRFNPAELISRRERAALPPEKNWVKAEFSINQNGSVISKIIQNTGSNEIEFTHSALTGTIVKISVYIFQELNGAVVPTYKGESQEFAVTSGLNPVVIQAVSRLALLNISADLSISESLMLLESYEGLADLEEYPWLRAELVVNGTVAGEIYGQSDGESGSGPIAFTYTAVEDTDLKIGINVYDKLYFGEYLYNEQVMVFAGTARVKTVAGENEPVTVPVSFEEVLAPVKVVYTVSGEAVELCVGAGIAVWLDGKKYYMHSELFSVDNIGEEREFSFYAPIGSRLAYAYTALQNAYFSDDGSCYELPAYANETAVALEHTVQKTGNVLRMLNFTPLEMTYVRLPWDFPDYDPEAMESTLVSIDIDISGLPADVLYCEAFPVSVARIDRFICFKRKDDQTLEKMNLTPDKFTPLPPNASDPFKANFGYNSTYSPWGFATPFEGDPDDPYGRGYNYTLKYNIEATPW